MLNRVPDTGSRRRDHQGPRTAVPLSTIEAIRFAYRSGASATELAKAYRVAVRTIHRYLNGPDPTASAVRAVLDEANELYNLGLTRDQVADVGTEVARRLRSRGWLSDTTGVTA